MKQFTKTTHTPSPWVVSTKKDFAHTNDLYHQIVALDGPRIDAPGFTITGCIDIHDARLIAAAPDLLSACEYALSMLRSLEINTGDKGDQAYQAIEEAIKKVKS